MKLDRNKLQAPGHPLFGFGGQQIRVIGKITLPVSFGDKRVARTEHITFDVVDMPYTYNAIISRGIINQFNAAIHPGYLCMMMPTPGGIIVVYGDQTAARLAEETATLGQKFHCLQEKEAKEAREEERRDQREAEPKVDIAWLPSHAQPEEETKRVQLFPNNSEREVIISALLDNEIETQLIQFLCDNSNIFAWSAFDLTGVDRGLIEHSLNVRKEYAPIKQKLHKVLEERIQAARAEVNRLMDVGVI